MTLRSALVATCACVGLGFGLWMTASATAADQGVVAATAVTASLPALGDESAYTYVGSKKCKKCHSKQHKSWAKTKMGSAFDTLKAGEAKEAKEKHGLDASKDYTTDAACLKCHTVGFGKPGGYETAAADDKKAVRAAKARMGVGCESCHGPGSAYVKIFDEIMKSKRKYKVEELYAAGMRKVDESVCAECHNDESPTIAAGATFDYAKKKDEGTHEHFPLKQREE